MKLLEIFSPKAVSTEAKLMKEQVFEEFWLNSNGGAIG